LNEKDAVLKQKEEQLAGAQSQGSDVIRQKEDEINGLRHQVETITANLKVRIDIFSVVKLN
jgi:SMC interacting uncharacterized protein involved in chromosome segregation